MKNKKINTCLASVAKTIRMTVRCVRSDGGRGAGLTCIKFKISKNCLLILNFRYNKAACGAFGSAFAPAPRGGRCGGTEGGAFAASMRDRARSAAMDEASCSIAAPLARWVGWG